MKVIDEAPVGACLMSGGAVTFAAQSPQENLHPIRMLARSSQPIDHWFWGRVVHDLSGFTVHKNRIPVDYMHDEPIGFLDVFTVEKEGLYVEGAIVLTGDPTDPAPKMMARQRGGVPYEASINFAGDGLSYEYIADEQFTQVNGYQFDGPGIVIREWPLRGVAVCPYGADMNTESQFGRAAEAIKVKQFNGGTMKTATKPAAELAAEVKPDVVTPPVAAVELAATPVVPAVVAPPAAAVELTVDPRAEAKRFKDAFGDEGAVWFADGLSFEAAQAKQAAKLTDRVGALEAKLAAAGQVTGETSAAGFTASDKSEGHKGFASKIRYVGAQPVAK